jgi:hypothetical protein
VTAIALASLKHAPGVTTAALALAAAAGEEAIAVEADASGGDLAARADLTLETGLLTLAAAARHGGRRLDLDPHLQRVDCGTSVLVGPSAARLAGAALATVGSRLASALDGRLGFLDLGRVSDLSALGARAPGIDLALLVAEPTVAGVEHVRVHAAEESDALPVPMAVLLVGDRPYRPVDVEEALGLPVVGALAVDPRGVAALHSDRGARRALVVRSARSVLESVRRFVAPVAVTA